jgi:tetratricopeptide (TPR) repeat protein
MAATEKALEIDPDMAEAWANIAYLKRGRRDWAGAKVAIDKAVKLAPNNFTGGTVATLASTFGQLDKSVELFERNVRLDPLSLSSLRALAIRYVFVGRFDEALEAFNRVLDIHPGYPALHTFLAWTYLLKGDAETALIEINKDPGFRFNAFVKVNILSTLGREAEAQVMIKQLLEGPADLEPLVMAATYAWRGENDPAFEWFEKARLNSTVSFANFLGDPWFKNLVSDPRYPLFLEKIGLLEYWQAMPPEYGGPPEAPE